MTTLEPALNPTFWQALEEYIRGRIIEQATSETVKVFYKFNTPTETELEFVKWTPRFLVVKYPPTSLNAGKDWKLGRNLLNYWLRQGVIRLEGSVPEWACVV